MTHRSELDAEAEAALDRLARLFVGCSPEQSGHVWDMATGRCLNCDALFPYADGVREDK